MHSLSRGGRPLFRCHSRPWRADSSYHIYVELPLQQPVARKSIFGAARYDRTTVDHDIARHLVQLAASQGKTSLELMFM